MARAKFKAPEPVTPEVEVPAGRPPVVTTGRYLREKATGILHPFTPAIAARGDLVEAYDGPLPAATSASPEKPQKPEPKPEPEPEPQARPEPRTQAPMRSIGKLTGAERAKALLENLDEPRGATD